jgi:mannitol-1-/sugar-/sorbitol-6-phosphatase
MIETDAFIFDLDGTLVDSSDAALSAMRAWCGRNLFDLDYVMKLGRGTRTEDTVALVAPHLDARVEARKIEYLERNACEGLLPIAGAGDFLRGIPTEKWAIVTSSSSITAAPKLEACKLSIPSVLITGEMVLKGKPDPEGFITAARRLGVAPDKCEVFEDADAGVMAAIEAGFKVIVVGGGCQIDSPRIAGRIEDFTEVEVVFEERLKVVRRSGNKANP